MSRLMGFMFAACLLAIGTSTSVPAAAPNFTLPQNAVKDTFLPFHPGAVRYYREIGIKIPDELAPTN